jgi:DNA polymerase I-like protein with 3'-5' exonuclease and polymerase domains
MARALFGVEAGNSLAKLADRYGLPPKGEAVYNTNGVSELAYEVEQELAEYCKHDVYLCEQILEKLTKEVDGGFPVKELKLIDMTLKMFVNPVLELDKEMLSEAIEEEKEKREALLAKIGVEEKALASNDQFANVLLGLGVTPPKKISKTTGKEAYAFAKNDALFQALLNSDNEDISLICEARLKVKSTLERTRAQRFVDIAGRGTLPVPLHYYGAHTGRWSASKGSGLNLQNLKRGSFLRKAICAPEGYTLVVCDLSQIEPRVLAYLADYQPLLEIFASGEDAYAAFGAQMFGIPGLNKKDHADLRQSAKSALLGCGYGMGWASFSAQLLTGFLGAPPTRYDKAFAKQLGVTAGDVGDFLNWERNLEMMANIPRTCTDDELLVHCVSAKKIIDIYRDK